MLYDFLVASGVIFGAMIVWWVVQTMVKKSQPEMSEDCDILEDRLGCKSCLRTDCAQYKP